MLHIVGFWKKLYSFSTNHVKTILISIKHVKTILILTNHVKIVLIFIKHVKFILINPNSRQNCIQLTEIT